MEVYRYYTIAAFIGPKRALEETVIDEYRIPENTTVLASVYDLHFDPEIWEDPQKFKPERFIDEDGNLKNLERLYIFGLGKIHFALSFLKMFFLTPFSKTVAIFRPFHIPGNY